MKRVGNNSTDVAAVSILDIGSVVSVAIVAMVLFAQDSVGSNFGGEGNSYRRERFLLAGSVDVVNSIAQRADSRNDIGQ